MSFIDGIIARARGERMKIILPESTEIRNLTAAAEILREGIAHVVLIGSPEEIKQAAGDLDVSAAEIVDPANFDRHQAYVDKLVELRSKKGMTEELAVKTLEDPLYFAVMMVKMGDADGMVAGAVNPTASVLRPALQILKTAPGTKLVSAFFLMEVPHSPYGDNGTFIFSDCGLNENPDPEALAEIAIASAASFHSWTGTEPKVAMLSYSTKGSAPCEATDNVARAARIAQERAPQLLVDGELQLDAAIVPEIAAIKAKGSPVAGQANVLVFPDLNSGNIGYKLVQRLAGANAYGPILQGIARPVNDLSRGCSAEDIVGIVAMTAVQAQQVEA